LGSAERASLAAASFQVNTLSVMHIDPYSSLWWWIQHYNASNKIILKTKSSQCKIQVLPANWVKCLLEI